ncbi:MAG TPA: bifunctional oligoribonuclease/PAP phosphatase NrnA [Candidatus Coproplasma stercoripullorum]|uniref:Bifunctional oligoribonuclease/PAP phosphatase NrnA n=1 Tax=Candidatus Coproplasma stercoripullorum TaxID=2840751 RepID=A0A9D1AFV9_9FIRM|nr:bifunctional oligoribonuclease/PAP phosphatase NrnA [Candidatus Coproplasma stercoripullorum]
MTTDNSVAAVAARIKKANKAAIFCHARPDGDALGSGLSLCLAMRAAGKTAEFVCEDAPPEKFFFIPEMREVKTSLPQDDYDLYIAVDCADVARMGEFGHAFSCFRGDTVCVDHHISNKGFAKLNCVRVCSATCEIMPEVLSAAGFEITAPMSNALMLGLITDSGTFTHSDVTAHTFNVAAELRSAGADVNKINYEMFSRQKKARALLFSRALSNLRFALDDRLAFILVTQSALDETGANRSMTEGFVDFPLSVDGVEVAIALLEMKRGQYKASLRSKRVDVNAVAATFGGGGHVLASGCMLFGEYEEVIDRLTYAVFQHL